MSKQTSGNLTQGPIMRVLFRLAVPIMAATFLSTAYSLTDMAWIGMLGSKAVAAIGVGGMYGWLSQGLAILARMGGQVHAGQAIGRGDTDEAKHYAVSSVQLVTLFGIVYGAICLLLPGPLIGFYNLDDPTTVHMARQYLMIACGASVVNFLNFTLTGLYTAQGDSKTPLIANASGLVLNMILDPLLILGFGPVPRLEVIGAAVATVFSQVVVLVILIAAMKPDNLLRKSSILHPAKKRYFVDVIRMGTPAALQSSFYCAISMVLTRMVGAYGEAAIAVQRLGGQIESLTWNTADGFGSAMNAFCAQNYGAKKLDRVRKSYRVSARLMLGWGALIGALFIFFPKGLAGLFFHEADVLTLSVGYFVIVGLSEPFMCLELMAIGSMSGLGRTKQCSIISIILSVVRIPLAWVLSRTALGLNGIWWALSVTSIVKGVILHIFFHRECNHLEKRLSE